MSDDHVYVDEPKFAPQRPYVKLPINVLFSEASRLVHTVVKCLYTNFSSIPVLWRRGLKHESVYYRFSVLLNVLHLTNC